MAEMMKAGFLLGKFNFEVREIEKPIPGDDEVLIRVKHVGVCGADIDFFTHGALGPWVVDCPSILGHEPAGEVAGFGKNVKGFALGDKVCVEPGEPCWTCDYCKKGLYNLCPDVQFHGVPGITGAFREFLTASKNLVFKLPAGVSTLEGALVEPLAVGLQAVSQSEAKPGMTATILGSGCVGLMILQALRIRGLREIYVVDIVENRLAKAKELGAAATVNASKVDTVEEIRRLTNGQGTDLTFEVSGNKACTLQTVHVTKRGGTITMLGLSNYESIPFDINGMICGQITVKSVFRYANQFPVAIDALKNGLVDLKSIVSDVFKLEDIQAGLEYNVSNKNFVIKEVIEI